MAPDRHADRGGAAVSAGDALAALMAGPLGRGLSEASRTARAWYATNGDRERAHTTGVWLRKSGRAGVDPVLVVALDSNLLAMELATRKELYLARLAFRGVAVSDIRFTVGRDQREQIKRPKKARREEEAERGDLPELTASELERVARATENLPDGLRQSVSRAMCASLKRAKG